MKKQSLQTIKRIIEIPLEEVQSPHYEANRVKYANKTSPCLICGKRVKDEATAKQVHLLTNGNIVSWEGDDIENSQGFHYVGADCAKKLVIKFAF